MKGKYISIFAYNKFTFGEQKKSVGFGLPDVHSPK